MVLRSSITDFISFTPVLPCQVSLVVGVVEEGTSKNDRKVSKVEVGSPWRGLCSGQLLGLEVLDFFFCNIMINQILNFFQIGQKLPAFFRSSSFKLPEDPTKPVKTVSSPLGIQFAYLIHSLFLSQKVIMIAAGSGIAPFRSFWQERQRQAQVGHDRTVSALYMFRLPGLLVGPRLALIRQLSLFLMFCCQIRSPV